MAIYNLAELAELGGRKAMCPLCINGNKFIGWDKMHKPVDVLLVLNKVVASDAVGAVRMNVLQRIIKCHKHGKVVMEEEL